MSTVRAIAEAIKQPDFDIRRLGRISMRTDGDLAIFNYTAACMYGGDMNDYERVCRGLILNRVTGEIVALPFRRFANWGEEYPNPSAKIVSITEKIDGSMVETYRVNGGIKLATRGSFDSEQALWATEFFNHNFPYIIVPQQVTLIFEAIYPANRICVDYGKEEALYLLAVMDRYSLTEWSDENVDAFALQWGFPRPAYYKAGNIEEVVTAAKALDANHEGWVVRYNDGTRFKVKGDQYREMHRILNEVSFVHTVEAILNETLDDVVAALPDEQKVVVKQWGRDIESSLAQVQAIVFNDMFELEQMPTRKERAIWVMNNRKETSALYFATMDGRDIRTIILKRFLENKSPNW